MSEEKQDDLTNIDKEKIKKNIIKFPTEEELLEDVYNTPKTALKVVKGLFSTIINVGKFTMKTSKYEDFSKDKKDNNKED